jgi:hypothetical protein
MRDRCMDVLASGINDVSNTVSDKGLAKRGDHVELALEVLCQSSIIG